MCTVLSFCFYAVLVFEDLVTVQPDSAQKIKEFLEVPARLRSFSAVFRFHPAESTASTSHETMSAGKDLCFQHLELFLQLC